MLTAGADPGEGHKQAKLVGGWGKQILLLVAAFLKQQIITS